MEEAAPDNYVDSPFVDEIAKVDLPKKLVLPSMRTYDGTSDPLNHVAFYKQNMLAASIPSEYRQQFASSGELEKRSSDLYKITQKPDETLRAFLNRFNKEKVSIPRCDIGTVVEAFRQGVLPHSDLYGELTKYPCHTFEDVQAKMLAYIRLEEDKSLIKRLDNMRPVVRWPRKVDNPNPRRDQTKWCEFHMDVGHTTEDCFTLRKEVAYLLKAGYLKDLIKTKGSQSGQNRSNQEEKPEHNLPPPPPLYEVKFINGGSKIYGLTNSVAKKISRTPQTK
ncbi:uncharacterized protein LOC141602316 [Silene latifolia]|uniref:uncharacterized protein LOC141602316 n=1 Tax=Silene latifolia TaxID=37657 RepID=UPI003D7702C9